MTDTTYNGYSNYETWATALWLDNDEGHHSHVRAMIAHSRDILSFNEHVTKAQAGRSWLQDALEDYTQEITLTEDTPANLASDLLAHSLSRVNWREMAENYLAEED